MERSIQQFIERYLSVSFLVNKRGAALMKCELDDITHDQYYVLRYIYKRGVCTSTELADVFAVNKSAITAMTNRLVEKGMIARGKDEDDRRVISLTLTEKGKMWLVETERKVYELVETMMTKLSHEEIEQFIQTYEKLAMILQEMEEKK
ncbi:MULTISPECIES: MarR family winged helix-turn-helix transcriptional regulator [Anoxybacillus]|uniref:MarR family transcriptional regulator n=1 Tax=Anoxybacillus flavithermus TaxID=33934 RepID=A0A178TE10_9BACL|nr:MarR family transcriptional regulator [Anoxybacillus flavithermus]ASA97738.1 MarR family transcriptional regulator [Anoxybacillus flavithermus]ELK22770.1 transcriptional regulator, MarR family [Anoxybacillus flavithermus TNO-09.006]MBE2905994.1 MarR family transcriptional regulator [Anoxybacillus flavithermus]MBE2908440.1 MarR family transcriptional regulator [Anoxybacillus flavithermus]MBE2911235.1 MarR family transcriptional regulator [Anoxybacillus flavithermus]